MEEQKVPPTHHLYLDNMPVLVLPLECDKCTLTTFTRLASGHIKCLSLRILEIKLINSFPPKIIWCYGIYPKLFDKMSDIEFHEGMPFDVEDITNAFVIIDDLMNEVGDDKRTFKLVHERKPS
ncbi:uncharacterized protein TNCV_389841 [Trichonephila clavipes]|nr:uncharacterized protein TNCV_389841 [Trichonephila clavipes]